jgi:hypothetical protein
VRPPRSKLNAAPATRQLSLRWPHGPSLDCAAANPKGPPPGMAALTARNRCTHIQPSLWQHMLQLLHNKNPAWRKLYKAGITALGLQTPNHKRCML